MRWSEELTPVRMRRIALLADAHRLTDMLTVVGTAGVVQLDDTGDAAVADTTGSEKPVLDGRSQAPADAELRRYAGGAWRRSRVAGLTGWCPAGEIDLLASRLAAVGASVVVLPVPGGVDPPTLIQGDGRRAFTPLVKTYGTVPYRDLDPSVPAGLAYVAMFGMMFGDAGQGLVLVAAAFLLRVSTGHWFAGMRRLWPVVAGAGAMATLFGLLYGEFFGPTGVLPVLWLAPLDDPLRLLAVAVLIGALLLALAYGLGIVNRLREGGIRRALYASSGIAGATLFLGLGLAVAGIWVRPLLVLGGVVAGIGLLLAVIGLFAESGGGATGIAQTAVGTFDLLVRLGSNLVSFARLAAFGMTHAALGWVVWRGTVGLAHAGAFGLVGAVVTFAVGNIITFALEALVAAIQALRLEYYELFSRVFVDEGNPFRPWQLATHTTTTEVSS